MKRGMWMRPAAEAFVEPLPQDAMERLTGLFQPPAKVIAEFSSDRSADIAATESMIFEMLQRHPCTVRQIAGVFGMHLNEISKYVGFRSE